MTTTDARGDDQRSSLSDEEASRYEWQIRTPDVGAAGQQKLKSATVLISRIGGVGGTVAMTLAAAGIGRLILAHAGNLRLSDMNRQLLMRDAGIDQPRIDLARRTLHELNPSVDVVTIGENISDQNAESLIREADVVVDAAPLFAERFAMNGAAVRLGKPLVEAAMYDFDLTLTTILPGRTPCLRCLYPEDPPHWKREFPVFAAVSSTAGSLAAVEVIKLMTGIGTPLAGTLLTGNLRSMEFRQLPILRDPRCRVCSECGFSSER